MEPTSATAGARPRRPRAHSSPATTTRTANANGTSMGCVASPRPMTVPSASARPTPRSRYVHRSAAAAKTDALRDGHGSPHGQDRDPRVLTGHALHDSVEPERGGSVAQAQVAVQGIRGEPVPGAQLPGGGGEELRLVAREGGEVEAPEAIAEQRQRGQHDGDAQDPGHAVGVRTGEGYRKFPAVFPMGLDATTLAADTGSRGPTLGAPPERQDYMTPSRLSSLPALAVVLAGLGFLPHAAAADKSALRLRAFAVNLNTPARARTGTL